MLPDDTRKRIENITAGTVIEGPSDTCTTIRNLLSASFATSTTVKIDFEGKSVIKEEQAQLLEKYSTENNLWVTDLPGEDRFLTRGGEARVYLAKDGKNVIKVNDAVYYATWLEFFNSILLHNLIFPNTAYSLVGFTKENDALLAVMKQPFIVSDAQVEIDNIKKLLAYNGFENTRRNDYLNKELGLILEDMHDENVLVSSATLFFIDTVFYTVSTISLQS
ncbi:hypothetical protein GWC95_06070 [Sediminibacterium roseum]|uniref:Uncharacterized protein n=1 Tax=Sediminibacterium roseum TaxID=1978412 RepID=A0ABW9ZQV5_9BACT|nr:hypothetical protein [Sediminibacterium roseum]NCI49481.1 hypothetical protein [Sediminibacterium roseum]